MYGVAVTAADYDNDGFVDCWVTGYGKTILYHNDGNGHFTDVTKKAGINVDGWGDQFHLARLRQGWMRRSFRRPLRGSSIPSIAPFTRRTTTPVRWIMRAKPTSSITTTADGTFYGRDRESRGIGAYVSRTMGVTAADFDTTAGMTFTLPMNRTENFLFHNKHDGTFEEIAKRYRHGLRSEWRIHFLDGPCLLRIFGRPRRARPLGGRMAHYNRLLHNTGQDEL